ncbi:MAG TPA: hypothetical protein VFY12_03410 [Arenimonas sp.]|nr:hypothetical protein [Arenimonas sp.]
MSEVDRTGMSAPDGSGNSVSPTLPLLDRLLALLLLWNTLAAVLVVLMLPWAMYPDIDYAGAERQYGMAFRSGGLFAGEIPSHAAALVWLIASGLGALMLLRRAPSRWHLLAMAFYLPQVFALFWPERWFAWVGVFLPWQLGWPADGSGAAGVAAFNLAAVAALAVHALRAAGVALDVQGAVGTVSAAARTRLRWIARLYRRPGARRNALLGARYFAARGPLLGCVTYMILAWLHVWHEASALELLASLPAIVVLIPPAYVLGVLPAALAGALLGPFRASYYHWRNCLYAGLGGAFVSSLIGLLYIPLGISFPVFESDPLILIGTHLILFAPAGGFAALVLARRFAADLDQSFDTGG